MATLSNAEKQFLKQLIAPVSTPLNIAWGLTIVSTLLLVYQAWLLASLFSTWLTNYFNDLPLATGISNYWFVGLTLCFIIRPLLHAGRDLISSKASLNVRQSLRQSLLTTMAKLGPNLRYFGSDGSLSSQVIDQTDALDGFISRFSVQKKVTVSTPIILLIAIGWQSPFATMLLFFTMPLVPIFMILIGKLTAKKSAEQFGALAQLSGRFLDWVRGMPTLKRLQATHVAGRDLALSSEDYRRRTMDVLKIAFLNGAVLELLAALSIALVAVYLGFGLMGILPWDKGHVPVPYFGALFILLLAPDFYIPLRQLGADYHAKAQAEGAVQSLLPIISAAKKIDASVEETLSSNKLSSNKLSSNKLSSNKLSSNKLSNNKTADSDIKESLDKNSSKIENSFDSANNLNLSHAFGLHLVDVTIQSPIHTNTDDVISKDIVPNTLNATSNNPNESPTFRTRLAPVSLTIDAGKRIALTGASGSGKSSLMQALMGFVDYRGSIALVSNVADVIETADATDVNSATDISDSNTQIQTLLNEVPVEKLRQHIGYLAQQVALMPLTIAENLRLAKPDASEQELEEVLKKVALWELIQRLPNGMHTQLGDRGQGLSGGQQQRLGIAQLLLRQESLWLLDEPTEHLDPDTAEHIHQLLERVSRGKTVIWVTHAHSKLTWLDDVVELTLPSSTSSSISVPSSTPLSESKPLSILKSGEDL